MNRGEAFAGFAAVGTVTATGAVLTGWALDRNHSFPVLGASLASAPGVLGASYVLTPPRSGSGDCGDGTMQHDEFLQDMWIPAVLGVIPSALAWWWSDASTRRSYAITTPIGPGYQGIAFSGRF